MLWMFLKNPPDKTPMARQERAAIGFLTAAVLVFSACVMPSTTGQMSSKSTGEFYLSATLLMPEVQEKLPISVGLYYSQGFSNRQEPLLAGGTRVGYLSLGRTSVQLLDQASSLLFARVVSVDGRPPLRESVAIDGVIEPHIEAFEINYLGGGVMVVGEVDVDQATQFLARIRYRFDLYDPSGALITSWDLIGDAAMLIPLRGAVDFFAVLVDAAVQDVVRQFVHRIDQDPEIKRWLSRKRSQ